MLWWTAAARNTAGQKLAPSISHLYTSTDSWTSRTTAWCSSDNQSSLLTWVPIKNTRSKTETADKASHPAAPVPGIHCWATPTQQSQVTGTRHADTCALSRLCSLYLLYYQLQTSNPLASWGDPPCTPQRALSYPAHSAEDCRGTAGQQGFTAFLQSWCTAPNSAGHPLPGQAGTGHFRWGTFLPHVWFWDSMAGSYLSPKLHQWMLRHLQPLRITHWTCQH